VAKKQKPPKDRRLPRPKYAAGSLNDLVSKANAGACFIPDTAPKHFKVRKHRLVLKAEMLSAEQLSLLITLLDGGAALIVAKGEPYAVKSIDIGWSIRGLQDGDEEYFVLSDLSGCSCPDHKYRNSECKHMEAVRCCCHPS